MRSPTPPRSRPYPARTPSLLLPVFFVLCTPRLNAFRVLDAIGGRTFEGVKLGARAGRSDPPGRMEALRPSAAACQPTSESIMDAHSASEDGRSRRSAPGASPQKPSGRSPRFSAFNPYPAWNSVGWAMKKGMASAMRSRSGSSWRPMPSVTAMAMLTMVKAGAMRTRCRRSSPSMSSSNLPG